LALEERRRVMEELPELPSDGEVKIGFAGGLGPGLPVKNAFTADQMRSYALAAVLKEREELAALCENLPTTDPDGMWFNHDMSAGAYACAAAIREKGK
jgi:hypothetical protein